MSSDLLEILKSKDMNLFNESLNIREKAIPLLLKIADTFPEYTPHDISHLDMVIEILNWFIPKDLKEKLKVYEIYFLINAAYFHDVGMANLDEIRAFNGENAGSIREYHHLRSEKYIEGNYNTLGNYEFDLEKDNNKLEKENNELNMTVSHLAGLSEVQELQISELKDMVKTIRQELAELKSEA